MIVLEVNNLEKVYGGKGGESSTKALNKICLTIEKGEFVGVMGPSGSGKTTLLNILGGVTKPTSGFVKVAGQNINEMDKNDLAIFRRQQLGFVFQEFNLLDSLNLKENIMLPMILDKRSEEDMEKRTNEVMALFDIHNIANKYPSNVSGGQQQRAAVSRAIINDPSIIFADEPTGNLDSKSAKAIMECFEKMNKELGNTIVMVTHDVFSASYCNKVIFIKDGRLSSQIVKKSSRRDFLDQIMNSLAVLGGDSYGL